MRCEDYLELLSPYLDQQLTAQEAEGLETHLKTCKHCREELEILEAIGTSLNSLEDKEVPEGFHAELMGKIYAEKQIKPFYQHKFFTYGSSIAAVFVLVVIFSQGLDLERFLAPRNQEMAKTRSVMPEVASYTDQETDAAVMAEEANSIGARAMREMPMALDEWTITSHNLEETIAIIEEWAKANQYEIQTIIQGDEATLSFGQPIDREALKEVIETQENIQDFQWVEMQNEGLMLIITQSTP